MSERAIANVLIEHGLAHMRERPALIPFTREHGPDILLNDLDRYPHAFVTACLMARQIRAESAWQIPFELKKRLGTFEFKKLAKLPDGKIKAAFAKKPVLHRFRGKMAKCFIEAIRHINDAYDGDASKIWSGKPNSAVVVYRFLQFHGVGPKIATMTVNILARKFKIRFADYYSVDISADIQVRRVFGRLKLTTKDATVQEIVYKARALSPRFPGLLDFPAWEIGRNWCRPRKPDCASCYMRTVCPSSR